MIKKTFVAAAMTAAVLGTGGVALAGAQESHPALTVTSLATATTSGTASPNTGSPNPAATSTGVRKARGGAGHRVRARRHARLGNALHGTWVTRRKNGSTVTHDAIRGTVSAVSATSITVTAADRVSQTFAITTASRVRAFDAAAHKRVKATISAVKNGQRVRVVGIGTTKLTAKLIVATKR